VRDQGRVQRLKLWLSLAFGATCGADYLISGSARALVGAVLGLVGAIVILLNPLAQNEEEYERRRREGRVFFVAAGVVFVLLVATQAPKEFFWAFAAVLMLVAVIGVLWERISRLRG